MREVEAGQALPGLYPANAENKARYEAWKAASDMGSYARQFLD